MAHASPAEARGTRQGDKAIETPVFLKDALRERPGRSGGPSALIRTSPPQHRPRSTTPEVTCTPFWTPSQFRTFRCLTDMVHVGDPRSVRDASVWLNRFIEQTGKEVCDMMLAELRRQDALRWFKSKEKSR